MHIRSASRVARGLAPPQTNLVTEAGTFTPSHRALTPTDSNSATNAVFAAIPSNIAIHVTDHDRGTADLIADDPNAHAQSIDALHDRVTRLKPKTLKLPVLVARGDAPVDPDHDSHWIATNLVSQATAATLPPTLDDNKVTLRQRMVRAREFIKVQEPVLRKQLFPGLRSDATEFPDLWAEVRDRGEPLVVLELHGYKGAHEAMALIRDDLMGVGPVPTVIAVNGDRYVRGGPEASGSLVTAHFGIASFAPRVYPPFEPEDDGDVRRWMHNPSGGYRDMLAGNYPFMTRCPFDAGHPLASRPWAAPLGEALKLRRRDETWAHHAEVKERDAAIAAGHYDAYVQRKTLVNDALQWMGEEL